MRHRLVFRRAAFGLLLVLLPALAAADLYVPGKGQRLPDRGGLYLPDTFPCDQLTQDLILVETSLQTFADTTSGESAVNAYACEPGWNESGPEHIYKLTADTDLILDAWLGGNDPDLDLILLSDCDTDSCLVQANSELSAQLSQGAVVYLLVDGFNGAEGPYALTLQTRAIGIPESICNGGAVPIDLIEAGGLEYTSNLFEQPNQVSVYDCADYTIRGGERWYAMSIAAADTDTVGVGWGEMLSVNITASTVQPNLDLVLWIFDQCGPDAQCLAWVDDEVAGGLPEVLEWDNPDPEARTVYLAVDCIRPPETDPSGTFDLRFDTVVPIEVKSVTGVRNLFR